MMMIMETTMTITTIEKDGSKAKMTDDDVKEIKRETLEAKKINKKLVG